jgi:hypothetical protein
MDIHKCPHCNKSLNKQRLTKHLLSEYCSMCKFTYQCRGAMIKHKTWCKPKCNICLKEFKAATQLLEHLFIKHKIVNVQGLEWLGDLRKLKKRLKCKNCERCFYSLNGLSQHVRLTNGEAAPVMSCDPCKRQFKKSYSLEQHMISAHGFKIKEHKTCLIVFFKILGFYDVPKLSVFSMVICIIF